MNKKTIVSIFSLFAMGVLYSFVSYFTLNSIQGLTGVSFSWSHCLLPLLGAFLGMSGSCGLLASMMSIRGLSSLLGLTRYIYFGLPTFAASLCWSTERHFVRVGIPLACMILFFVHPVGHQASAYSLYWLLPILIGFLPKPASFFKALASTFTAHAVGSVMHLYMINSMSSAAWLGLIPVVACERLLLAMGMWTSYIALSWFLKKLNAVYIVQCAENRAH